MPERLNFGMSKARLLLRIFSTIFCTTGLLYQSCQLLSQYMSGKSVVSIEVKREIHSHLPGITVCYPRMLSMEMVLNYREDFQIYINRTQELMKKAIKDRRLHEDLFRYLDNVYGDLEMKLQQLIFTQPKFVNVVIDNLSLPFFYSTDTPHLFDTKRNIRRAEIQDVSIIDMRLDGTLFDKDSDEDNNTTLLHKRPFTNNSYDFTDAPVESVNFRHKIKCFTFFSYVNMDWRKVKFDLEAIRLTIEHNPNWFPSQLLEKYYIAIHSPKMIPEFRVGHDYAEVAAGQDYLITFSKININRHYSELEFDCKEYGRRKSRALRSDCVTTCMVKRMEDDNVLFGIIRISMLLRKKHLKHYEGYNITRPGRRESLHLPRDPIIELRQECYKICKHNCRYTYYMFDINMVAASDRSKSNGEKRTIIIIQHNRLPDLFVRHIPETTFITFVGNFGGLLGMWLGLNVLVIFDNLFSLSNRIIMAIGKNKQSRNRAFIQRNKFFINQNLNIVNVSQLEKR